MSAHRWFALAAWILACTATAAVARAEDTNFYSLSDTDINLTGTSVTGGGCGCEGACGCDDGCDDACGCEDSCDDGCGCSCYLFGPDEAWTLFGTHDCTGITAGGWAQIGYHTAGRNGNGTGLFNNYPNRVQAQQLWAYVEKAADTEGCGFDWGFRFDYVYGTDGPDTQAFGNPPNSWDEGWDNGVAYGHAIPQAYVDLAYNDLSVRLGHFYTIVGYEVVPATGNFFYSHSRSMVLTEPFTHTGALATYNYSDNLTLYGGYTFGWDTGFDRFDGDTFLGGFSAQLTENIKFTYTTTIGNFGFGPGGSDDDGYSQSIVVDFALTERLNYVFQSDYIKNDLFVGGGAGEILSFNNYLLYTVNDCWGFGGRLEWWESDGNDVDATSHDILALTLGANYRPHANVVFRPEVRWDWFGPDIETNQGLADSTTFGVDMIVTF